MAKLRGELCHPVNISSPLPLPSHLTLNWGAEVGKAFDLQAADLDWIPSIPYGTLGTEPGGIPDHYQVAPNQKQNKTISFELELSANKMFNL